MDRETTGSLFATLEEVSNSSALVDVRSWQVARAEKSAAYPRCQEKHGEDER